MYSAGGKQRRDSWIIVKALTLIYFLLECGYCGIIGYPTLSVLDGGKAELPCDLNVTTTEDDVTLVLWHRDNSGSPVYSLDVRASGSLSAAKHFPSLNISSRSYFNVTGLPPVLKIDSVRKTEEGMYRCRVEYRRARTETADIMLMVIVPPKEAIIMDEYGQHLRGIIGPYNEGFPLALACEGEGGDPSPAVRWWRDAELLDDSYYITPQGFARNELLLASLKRTDLMIRLTCQVSNSNLSAPVTSSVIIDMNLKPTDVHITSLYRPLSSGHPSEIVCVARGARPPAQISWWLDGEKITSKVTESTAREENLTVSSLVFNPGKHDNQRNLSCRGDNPQLPDSVLEDTWVLDIHFPPEMSVRVNKDAPFVEGTDIRLTCVVRANPLIAELEWLKDGVSLGPPRRDTRNRTLEIRAATPDHKGRYQCSAHNSEGKTLSEPLLLRIHYAPRCQSVRSRVYGVGRTESVSVACEVDASPTAVSFAWALDDSKILSADQFHTNGTKSVATISPRSPQDYGVLKCWASNTVGRQKEPCSFRIIPAGPPEEPKNCLISNTTADCISLECEVGHDGGLQQLFHLEVYSTDSDKFLANVSSHSSPSFSVCLLPPRESFVLVVYSLNGKGKSKPVAIHASTMSRSGSADDDDDSGTFVAILGVVLGAIAVLILLGVVILLTVKLHAKRRASADREYSIDESKGDAHHFKDCKDSYVSSSLGPDIIPEKGYFQERSDSIPKVIEVEQGVNPSLAQSDPSSRKYREYPSVSYPDDPALITTPRKLRIAQPEVEIELTDPRNSVETPLISSLNPILQQWPTHKKESLCFSTPV